MMKIKLNIIAVAILFLLARNIKIKGTEVPFSML